MTLRVLALDAALARCSAAVVTDGSVVAERREDTDRGHAALLPVMVRDVLDRAGNPPLDCVAVTVGPGSFTGIRAGLALAHGIALGFGVPVIAVTVGEALAAILPPLPDRTLWTATDSRRDRVFLEIGDTIAAHAEHAIQLFGAQRVLLVPDCGPGPGQRVVAAGSGCAEAAARR
jgi:tRNA threonylcarbamoyladenosine biosynthesis protein TsaB